MTSSGVHGRGQLQPAPRAIRWWLTVGTLWSVLFTAVYLVEGATRPGYDAWRQAISTLSLGPGGWVQQANFVVLGVVTLGLALVWRKILEGGVCATWYPIMRAVEGLSLIGIGFFSTDPTLGYPPGSVSVAPFSTAHGTAHFGFLFMIIFAQMCGLFIISRRFSGNPDWRGWVFYSILSGVLINVLIALFGITNAHQFEYAGVFERVATNIEALWGLAIVGRLWHGARLVNGHTGTREPIPSAGHRPTSA
jgi:hypothetical protein